MRITARFVCKEGCLTVKFNGNSASTQWLDYMTEELAWFFTIPKSSVKFVMWSTDATDDGLTFRIDIPLEKSIEELNDSLYKKFRGYELFRITQKDIDNFTWNSNYYWIKLIDNIEENMGYGLYPMLEKVKIQEIAE